MLPDTEAVTDAVLPLMVSHNNRVLPSASLWYIKVLPFSDSYHTDFYLGDGYIIVKVFIVEQRIKLGEY